MSTYETFENWKPKEDALRDILRARAIIEEYRDAGITLTLRQLYYQFVARDFIPNTEKSYKRLGNILKRGRQGGVIDWEAIEDRGRTPVEWSQFESMRDCLEEAVSHFRMERQMGQEVYVELWVEKDALASVLRPIAARYHVTLMVNRGYSSASAMRASAERVRECVERYGCDEAVVLYLGDLDPSGEDMVRDIRDRLGRFLNSGQLVNGSVLETPAQARRRKPIIDLYVKKLALTMDQVNHFGPPPNPTKLSDSRAKDFIRKFGRQSWEVDALPPTELRTIIEEAIEEQLDMSRIEEIKERESEDREALTKWLQSRYAT